MANSEKFIFISTVLYLMFSKTLSLFRKETLDTVKESRRPYLLRHLKHVYYVGTMDNGTLVCDIPGAVEFRWRALGKEVIASSYYVQSWEVKLDLADKNKPWLMDITPKNYGHDSMIVLCEGVSGYDGQTMAQVIWVITRLHSPLGFVTDPIICPGVYSCHVMMKSYTRNLCQADAKGKSYRGTISHTREGVKCADWNMAKYPTWEFITKRWLDCVIPWYGGNNPYAHQVLPLARDYGFFTASEVDYQYKERVNYKYQYYNIKYKSSRRHRRLNGKSSSIYDRPIFSPYYSAIGEHNFCRARKRPKGAKDTGASCSPFPEGLERDSSGLPHACDVPSCSDCIYGTGRGSLLHYTFKLPKYIGRGVNTMHKYTAKRQVELGGGEKEEREVQLYRRCYRDKGNDEHAHKYRVNNVCSMDKITINANLTWRNKKNDPPFCMVRKGNSDKGKSLRNEDQKKEKSRLTKAKCRLRQCTIRVVWFLFYDQDNNLVIDSRASNVPRRFVFVEGRKATIKYYAFGMHLLTGLSFGTVNSTRKNVVNKWKNSVLRVPRKCSLSLGELMKADEGDYYLEYHFEEAVPEIDVPNYVQEFRLVVKKPLRIALTPLKISICETEKAVLHLKLFGEMRATAIQWSYTLYESAAPTPVLRETWSIKVSADKLKVTVSQTAWIYVTVLWKYGTLKAQAKVDVVGRPLLQHVSPLLILAQSGDNVKIAVATNDVSNKLNWVVDAQIIGKVPDDPNMAFSRIRTDKEMIHVLKIDNVQPHHFGIYTVQTSNALKCRRSIDFILRRTPELREEDRRANSEISLAREAIDSFGKIMDFMNQECSQIIKSSNPPVEKKLPASEKPPTNASKEMNETRKEDLENEKEGKNRKKRNAPVDIEKAVSSQQEPLCIDLSHHKPYFQINLGALMRIKGIRLLKPFADDQEDMFNNGYRLLYSTNGCQWKIYGILQRILHGSSNNTNNTNTTNSDITNDNTISTIKVTQQDLVGRLRDSFVTELFSSSGNITWVGNKTLLFAKQIRLVPTAIDSTIKKACIRIDIFGCSAAILAQRGGGKSTGVNVGAIVGGVFGGLFGSVLFGLAAWWFWHLEDKHKEWCKVKKIILKRLFKIVDYTKKKMKYATISQADSEDNQNTSSDSSDSESSQEHVYWEVTN